MTAVDAPADAARLLAGFDRPGHGPGLAIHEHVHGPLPLPDRRGTRDWAQHLFTSIDRSGLTGRGGAGFPTARKLATVGTARRRPVVVVNATEGEPASRKDWVLSTAAPHLVLDGADIVARALRADSVNVCVPRNRPEAARSCADAIGERARTSGRAAVPIEVAQPPDRYVAGEESGLVHWLDGGEATPTFRPDRPAILRLHGRPVLVDNAETLAHVALIARFGPEWFRSIGAPEAPGTALVTISGAVQSPGVFEVPLGTPVRSVLAGAGAPEHRGAVLLGGYGGSWLAAGDLSTPWGDPWLRPLGCSVGAGVMVALPEGACGLAETARVARWMAGESAGQCGPCVFGLPSVAEDLEQLAFRRASGHGVQRLRARLDLIAGRGACRHPDGVVRLVQSALRAFAADVDHHLRHGPCHGAHRPGALSFPEPVLEWR